MEVTKVRTDYPAGDEDEDELMPEVQVEDFNIS